MFEQLKQNVTKIAFGIHFYEHQLFVNEWLFLLHCPANNGEKKNQLIEPEKLNAFIATTWSGIVQKAFFANIFCEELFSFKPKCFYMFYSSFKTLRRSRIVHTDKLFTQFQHGPYATFLFSSFPSFYIYWNVHIHIVNNTKYNQCTT